MGALEISFAVFGITAGLATGWICAVIAWRVLRGPRS